MTNHPPCPKCDTPMNSNGALRWICVNCGFSPLKLHRNREVPDYSERAPCPVCGATHGTKIDGSRYKCGDCGKQYQRNWQDKLVIQEDIILIDFQEANIGAGINTP